MRHRQAGHEGLQNKEAYAILHGYNPLITGNPQSIWADHLGVHIQNSKFRHLRGTWRAACDHLEPSELIQSGTEFDQVREQCKPGWQYHFRGSWRVMVVGCTGTRSFFGIGQKDLWEKGEKLGKVRQHHEMVWCAHQQKACQDGDADACKRARDC